MNIILELMGSKDNMIGTWTKAEDDHFVLYCGKGKLM